MSLAQRLDLRGVRLIYRSFWRPLLRGAVTGRSVTPRRTVRTLLGEAGGLKLVRRSPEARAVWRSIRSKTRV